MVNKYVIKDAQTGDYSPHTEVDSIFESCVDDYMTNMWSDEEEQELIEYFNGMNEGAKMNWVRTTYEYDFYNPAPKWVSRWEKYHGKKFN